MEEAVLILVFLFVTLRAILQSRRRLNCRPGFIAGQYRHVALIWSDNELFTRSHNWTGLVPGQAGNTGSAIWPVVVWASWGRPSARRLGLAF